MIELAFDDIETTVRIPLVITIWDSKLDLLENGHFVRQQLYAQMMGWA